MREPPNGAGAEPVKTITDFSILRRGYSERSEVGSTRG